MKIFKETPSFGLNLLSKGTKMSGSVVCEGDIRIDDTFKGNITTKGNLIIGSFGYVEGDVKCETIEISGKLKGRIIASKQLTLKSTAVIDGDILTSKMIIEPGAIFSGCCKMEEITEKTKFKRKRKTAFKLTEEETISTVDNVNENIKDEIIIIDELSEFK